MVERMPDGSGGAAVHGMIGAMAPGHSGRMTLHLRTGNYTLMFSGVARHAVISVTATARDDAMAGMKM
jgi:hypothetical protein